MTMTAQRTLNDHDFRAIVDADIRGTGTPDQSALLRSEEFVDRWLQMLLTIKTSVEGQLGARRSDLNRKIAERNIELRDINPADQLGRRRVLNLIESERADYEKWRASVLRFKSGVEAKIAEASMTRHNPREEFAIEERNEALVRAKTITDAVKRHYDLVQAEYDPTEADLELWAALGLRRQ